MLTRRSLLSALPAAGGLAEAAAQGAPGAPHRLAKHRNLFNGDSCTYFYNPELWQPEGGSYRAKAIHRFIDVLADSGIDTFLINPNAQTAWYPSKKLQTVLDGYRRGDREFFRGHALATNTLPEQMDAALDKAVQFYGLYQDLIDVGVDWLAETSKGCRRRGVSPWVSVRMNDMHGAGNPKGSHFNCELFKHDQYRLAGVPFDPKEPLRPNLAGLNYERPEVRAFMMSHIREYLEHYDFEGMELDWLRNPLCCNPQASQQAQDTVTRWLSEVRQRTDARGKQLGKPVPFGLRIPGNLGYLKSIGIDVPKLAREGLIDFIGFSNFWQTSWDMPYDELRQQIGPGVAFYGVVEDAPNWLLAQAPSLQGKNVEQVGAPYSISGIRYMAASPQMQWANAAGKLAMGVHGTEQFNFFCTDQVKVPGLRSQYAALKQNDYLEVLRLKPKHYCLQSPSGRMSADWELPEPVPITIEAKSRREFRLAMCREPQGRTLTVQVVIARQEGILNLGVSVNGQWPVFQKQRTQELLFPVGPYTLHLPENEAYNFQMDAAAIFEGWNRILVFNKDTATPVRVVSLELGIRT